MRAENKRCKWNKFILRCLPAMGLYRPTQVIGSAGEGKNARFKHPVTPGDVLELSCELIEQRGPVGYGKAVARVGGKIAAQGELTFVIQ